MELNQLQILQNCAAWIVPNSSFDTPIIEKLCWKIIEELISTKSKIMVFKSIHEMAPQYMCNMFTKNSELAYRTLCTPQLIQGCQRKL